MDPVADIFAAFDNSATKLARATGLPPQTVWDWQKAPANIPVWRRPVVAAAIKSAGVKVSKRTQAYLADTGQVAA